MTDSDVKSIRLVGGFCLGLGILLMFGTILAAIFVVYAASAAATFNITVGTLADLVLSLGMSLTLSACGAQIQRFHPPLVNDVESLRLSWTALFVVMVITAVIGANLVPSLGFLSLGVAVLLLAIRRSVIRAGGR